MKKLLYYFSLVAVPAIAQTPSIQWEKNVNGQYSNYDNVYYTWKDPSGNMLIAGGTGNDAFVMKVDVNGNQLLQFVYDGPLNGYDVGNAVRSDASGNIYLGGTTDGGLGHVPFVVKFNASGVKQWEYVQSGATQNNELTALALDNFSSPGSVYFTGNKNDSSCTTRLDAATGALVWEKQLWPHGKFNDLDVDNNGHPLVCGYHAFAGTDADFYAAVLDINTGYPLRGYWRDGAAADSTTDPQNRYDRAAKIKAGPAGTFAVMGTIYNNSGEAAVYVAKFGSTGNTPTWTYTYDAPNHLLGEGVQFFADASFANFYYLAEAYSTAGMYSYYCIVGKVNNNGIGLWEKQFGVNGTSLFGKDMTVDANGNAHFVADIGNPYDILYTKLNSTTGATMGSLQYDNLRGGGNAYDYSTSIVLDNTGHPYIVGSSNASTYTLLDVLLVRLNTNATLDWDVTYDMFGNSQDAVYNVQIAPWFTGGDEIVNCGQVINNITGLDVAITSYDEGGNTLWQEIFDDNNGGDGIVGFEKSVGNNFFLCTRSFSTGDVSITEFYRDGTTNFTTKPTWSLPNTPVVFKIDSIENSFLASSVFGYSDFYLMAYMRNSGAALENVPTAASAIQTVPQSITTDNANEYVAGYVYDGNAGNNGQHILVQKFDLAMNRLWSTKIMGFDSTAGPKAQKIVYDRASGAVYLVGIATSVGSTIEQTVIAKIDVNGNVIWVKSENAANTRHQFMQDMMVKNGKIYITGYAYPDPTPTDHMVLAECWDLNGNKQWEYIYDKPNTVEEGTQLVVDNSGNLFVTGKANGSLYTTGQSDILTLKVNPTGNLIWSRVYDGNGNGDDLGVSIALSNNFASNPRVYVAGNTQSNQGLYYDIGTLKYCDLPAPTISYGGSTSICQNSSITLASAGVGSGSVVWSPGGQNTGAIVANTSGGYYFTYSEADGCATNSDTVNINIKGAPTPVQICMVTVDDSSKHNMIIWDKTAATPDVIGFNIYREDLTNIYHMVGSVPITALSEFVDLDPVANPNTNTKRYKMTTVDSCGNESQMSNYHNTIYILSNGSGQFSWSLLYTIENTSNPVAQYILLRDDYNTNNWHAVDSTAGTQFSIVDANFSAFQPTANWRVATQWNIQCTPTQRQAGGNTVQSTIVKSKSNIANNRVAGIGTLNETNVIAYPNPAKNNLTVQFPAGSKTTISMIDLLGNEVYVTTSIADKQEVDLSRLAAGTYLLQVSNASGKFIKRIVKE